MLPMRSILVLLPIGNCRNGKSKRQVAGQRPAMDGVADACLHRGPASGARTTRLRPLKPASGLLAVFLSSGISPSVVFIRLRRTLGGWSGVFLPTGSGRTPQHSPSNIPPAPPTRRHMRQTVAPPQALIGEPSSLLPIGSRPERMCATRRWTPIHGNTVRVRASRANDRDRKVRGCTRAPVLCLSMIRTTDFHETLVRTGPIIASSIWLATEVEGKNHSLDLETNFRRAAG